MWRRSSALAAAAPDVTDLLFNDLLRRASGAGLLAEPLRWREWRELRNTTSHAYDEATAQAVAGRAAAFLVDANELRRRLENSLGR